MISPYVLKEMVNLKTQQKTVGTNILRVCYTLRSPLYPFEIGHICEMTPGFQWSPFELTIIVYFSSRHIRPQVVRCLLLRRGYARSISAIKCKMKSIIHQYPELRFLKDNWDLTAVDMWLDDILGDHESVNQIVWLSAADAEDILDVRLATLWI